jgi:hypothetical protein
MLSITVPGEKSELTSPSPPRRIDVGPVHARQPSNSARRNRMVLQAVIAMSNYILLQTCGI